MPSLAPKDLAFDLRRDSVHGIVQHQGLVAWHVHRLASRCRSRRGWMCDLADPPCLQACVFEGTGSDAESVAIAVVLAAGGPTM